MKESVVLFVHGGPGLSASYFGDWFSKLSGQNDLFFYDQDYSNPNEKKLIEALSDQFISVYKELQKRYKTIHVYTHSWGSFLLLSAAPTIKTKYSWKKIGSIIISNPADLTWNGYEESGERLFEGATDEEISAITTCQDGIEMMNLALPLYVGNKENVPKLLFDRYDLSAYEQIESEMTGYDLTTNVDCLPLSKTYTIYCEKDFETSSGSEVLFEKTHSVVFPLAGHFPFAERNEEYLDLVAEILGKK